MPFTPEEAKRLNKELTERIYIARLTEARSDIDSQLQTTPNGTSFRGSKRVLDTLSKEYGKLGWHCRQYTKKYFDMEINCIEISAAPFQKNKWKEKLLNFLRKI